MGLRFGLRARRRAAQRRLPSAAVAGDRSGGPQSDRWWPGNAATFPGLDSVPRGTRAPVNLAELSTSIEATQCGTQGKNADWDIRSWDAEFLELSGRLEASRRAVLERTTAEPGGHGGRCWTDLLFEYQSGWAKGKDPGESLKTGLSETLLMGSTQAGPHRADIRIRFDDRQARKLVSRGQQKLLASAMVLAATATAQAELERPLLLLLDDPAAELDAESMARLMRAVAALGCQVIATSLERQALDFPETPTVFHVEQGQLSDTEIDLSTPLKKMR